MPHVIKVRNEQSCPNKKTRRSEKGSFRKNVDGLAVIINRFVASWPAKDLGIRDAMSEDKCHSAVLIYVSVVLLREWIIRCNMTRNNKFAMLIKQRKMLKEFETFSIQILFAELLFNAIMRRCIILYLGWNSATCSTVFCDTFSHSLTEVLVSSILKTVKVVMLHSK